mgnify:CR=1 FL=1
MKKEKYYKFMYVISSILVMCFIISVIIDYFNYDPLFTSFPFYVNILIRTLEFILPSVIIFIIGIYFKKNLSK